LNPTLLPKAGKGEGEGGRDVKEGSKEAMRAEEPRDHTGDFGRQMGEGQNDSEERRVLWKEGGRRCEGGGGTL